MKPPKMGQLPAIDSCQVVAVHDGDTATFRLRTPAVSTMPGISVLTEIGPPLRARMGGYAARELSAPGGPEARDYLRGILAAWPGQLGATLAGWDYYGGRYDLFVWTPAGWLHDMMVSAGYAASWNGRGKQPVAPWPIPVPAAVS